MKLGLHMTLAETCVSVAFCQCRYVMLEETLVPFQCQLLIRYMQLLFELTSLRKSDARFSKCHMHCVCYLCN